MSPRELAEATGIPRGTWYEAISRGRVPTYRLGRSVRVAEEDAARFVESLREVAR
jgi:excisionase family DNA binding protein